MKLKKKQFKRLKEISRRINECIPSASDDLNILIADIESAQKPKTIKEEPLVGAYIESLKEEARDMFFKEGKSAVENSLSDRSTTKGIRNLIENLGPIAIKGALKQQRTKLDKAMGGNSGFATGGVCVEEEQYNTLSPEEQRKSNLSDYLNRTGAWSAENTVTYNVTVPKNRKYKGSGEKLNGIMDIETDPDPSPQIGDVGYFWDDRYPNVLYTGILSETKIDGSGKVVYYGLKNKNISKDAALFGYFSKTPPELR